MQLSVPLRCWASCRRTNALLMVTLLLQAGPEPCLGWWGLLDIVWRDVRAGHRCSPACLLLPSPGVVRPNCNRARPQPTHPALSCHGQPSDDDGVWRVQCAGGCMDLMRALNQGANPSSLQAGQQLTNTPANVVALQGVFFNDAYILDTSTWSWSKPQTLNTPPAPRYHHSCVMVNGRCVIYGGVNAKQTFEGLVVVETKVDHDISNIAAELSAMVRPYGAGQSLASGSADVGLNASNHSPPPAALLPAHVLPAPQLGTSGVQASNLATGSVDLVRASTSSSNSTTNGQQAVQQNQDSSPSGHGPPPRSYSSQTAGPSTATAGLYATSPAHVAALQTQQPVLVVTQHPTAPHSIQVPRQAQLNQPSVLVSSLVPATTIASVPADVMQLQLTELLIRRNTEELSNQVSQKAAVGVCQSRPPSCGYPVHMLLCRFASSFAGRVITCCHLGC
jgi:hypothetical protein